MHNKFFRNSLMMACVSLAISGVNAMDVPEEDSPHKAIGTVASSQSLLESDYIVQENMTSRAYAKDFDRSIEIESRNWDESFVRQIFIGKSEKDGFYLTLHTKGNSLRTEIKNDFTLNNISFKDEVTAFDATYLDNKQPGKFLAVFYRRNLIPDFLVNRIIKHIGIEDFRQNIESMKSAPITEPDVSHNQLNPGSMHGGLPLFGRDYSRPFRKVNLKETRFILQKEFSIASSQDVQNVLATFDVEDCVVIAISYPGKVGLAHCDGHTSSDEAQFVWYVCGSTGQNKVKIYLLSKNQERMSSFHSALKTMGFPDSVFTLINTRGPVNVGIDAKDGSFFYYSETIVMDPSIRERANSILENYRNSTLNFVRS